MSIKTQQALELIKNQKYKKALVVLKKVNQKLTQQTYLSLELEGICLLKDKQYLLSELTFKKSLSKADTQQLKINTLANLKALSLEQNNHEKACTYIKQSLQIDGAAKYAELRLQLCQLSYNLGDYQTVVDYAPNLVSLSEFSHAALSLLASSYACLNDIDKTLLFATKALVEVEQFNQEQAVLLLDALDKIKDETVALQVLNKLASKYRHQQWYTSALNRRDNLSNSKGKSNQINVAPAMVATAPVEIVVGENVVVVELIKTLMMHLKKMGASFNKGLRIVAQQGNLSVQSYTSPNQPEHLINIPIKCMPLLNDYQFSVTDDKKIVATPNKKQLNANANAIMALMVDIYNATQKLETWSETYPLFTLKQHPQLINTLFANQKYSAKLVHFKTLYDQSNWDQLLLDTFIGSREFVYKSSTLASAGIHTKNPAEKGFLAIIDFLNHKLGAMGYSNNEKAACMEIHGVPDRVTREVSVQYNLVDPVLTYLVYGFVDINASVLFSCITELTTQTGLTLSVLSRSGIIQEELPDELKHLGKFMPAGVQRTANTIKVSNLIIPDTQSRDTLPQVLRVILTKCDLNGVYHNEALLISDIAQLEKQLLLSNMNYWCSFKAEVLAAIETDISLSKISSSDLLTLCDFSIAHIANYMKFRNIPTS